MLLCQHVSWIKNFELAESNGSMLIHLEAEMIIVVGL